MADSLSIYGEGTFEEQIQELLKYLARSESEETRVTFIQPFQEILSTSEGDPPLSEDEEKRKKVIKLLVAEIKGLGDGNDREIEGFFNLVYCHVLSLYPPDSADSTELVESLVSAITSSPPTEHTTIKYRTLTNLFNAVPNRSTLRPRVYQALLSLTTENEELEVLQLKPSHIEKWLEEWDITDDEKSKFIKSVSNAFAKLGQEATSYSYMVSYLRTISPNSSKAEEDSLSVIATALRLPSIFNFDSLLKIDAVRVAKDHPLFSLLKILLGGGLAEYHEWLTTHEAVLNEFVLDKSQLERKIKLLVLADLGSRNVGRDVPYSEIASALEIEKDQVEAWVIDVIRTRLMSGRLSQPDETLHVTRSTSRSFDQHEWDTVEKRLVAWKTGLEGVLEVIAAARKSAAAIVASRTLTPDAARPAQPQVA
ncbi:PCI-domain-containing protein [Hysterangium stoloniferum]|nr:PCI-domain-containing protein [Hysterangium stoloniferum]